MLTTNFMFVISLVHTFTSYSLGTTSSTIRRVFNYNCFLVSVPNYCVTPNKKRTLHEKMFYVQIATSLIISLFNTTALYFDDSSMLN